MFFLKFDYIKTETILLITKLIDKYIVSVYYYNFVILKNENFKKIICAFPGTKNYVQLALEIILSFLAKIPNKNNENCKVSKMFYDVFETIKEDFVQGLTLLSEINDLEYQTIFIGHSLGGALASISAFFCIDRNIIKNEPILITFGQPRVWKDLFARYLTDNIKQIYRIARLKDPVSLIPFTGIKDGRKIKEFIFFYIDKLTKKFFENRETLFWRLEISIISDLVGKLGSFLNPILSYTHIGVYI